MNYTDVSAASSKAAAVINEIEKVIIGKRTSVTMLMVALLAGGHVLIEDVPGVGKTTLSTNIAYTLSRKEGKTSEIYQRGQNRRRLVLCRL